MDGNAALFVAINLKSHYSKNVSISIIRYPAHPMLLGASLHSITSVVVGAGSYSALGALSQVNTGCCKPMGPQHSHEPATVANQFYRCSCQQKAPRSSMPSSMQCRCVSPAAHLLLVLLIQQSHLLRTTAGFDRHRNDNCLQAPYIS